MAEILDVSGCFRTLARRRRRPQGKRSVVSIPRRTAIACLVSALLPVAARAGSVLRIGGSGACQGSSQLLAAPFRRHTGNELQVAPPLGSSGGLRGLLGGSLDVACISRPLTPAEEARGLSAVALATSPFVVIVHPDTRLDSITVAELARLYADPAATYADGVRARPVLRPADDSDTRILAGLSPAMAEALAACGLRPGVPVAATDHDVVRLVETVPGAIGLSTLGLVLTGHHPVKMLSLGEHPPLAQGRVNPRYAVQKQLYLVTTKHPTEPVRQFVGYARSAPARDLLQSNGYLPVSSGTKP